MLHIGSLYFWLNSLKRARPQDVVVLDNKRNCKFNLCSNEILTSYLNIVFDYDTLDIAGFPKNMGTTIYGMTAQYGLILPLALRLCFYGVIFRQAPFIHEL